MGGETFYGAGLVELHKCKKAPCWLEVFCRDSGMYIYLSSCKFVIPFVVIV